MGWARGYPYIFRHPHAPSTMRRTWAYAWGVRVVVGGRGRLTTVVRWRNAHGGAVSERSLALARPALPHPRAPRPAPPPPCPTPALPRQRARAPHAPHSPRSPARARPVPPRPRASARARPAPPASPARAPRPAPRAAACTPAPAPHPSPINCESTCGVVGLL